MAAAVAACGVLVSAVVLMGVVDLLVVPLQMADFYDGYLLEAGWGLLLTVLVAVPFGALAVRPASTAAMLQLLVCAASLAVAAVAAGELGGLWPAVALLALVTAHRSLAPGGAGAGRPARSVPALAVLAGVSAVGVAPYALDLVRAAREPRFPVDITLGLDHWPVQAALALAVPAVTAVAATGARGWPVAAWTAGSSGAGLGAVSVAYPGHAASLGRAGGAGALLWGVLVAAAVLRRRRPGSAGPPAVSSSRRRSRRRAS